MSDKLVLVHLSDIHFGKPGMHGAYDLDRPLRNEIERDLTEMGQLVGPARGILISGDVAFAGKEEEYQAAIEWLKQVSRIVGCKESDAWVVPGNHDVDRSVISQSKTFSDWHDRVRRLGHNHVDDELQGAASDEALAAMTLRAIQHYNDFAAKFSCGVSLEKPYWEHDLPLNDGSILRLRGLTSIFISDEHDDAGANKLILGSAQVGILRTNGVEYLTVCHHPPQWLLDEDAVDERLRTLARIQLFGHKHSQTILHINNCLRLTAGAVHPDRQESAWLPRYNLLSLTVVDGGGGRLLRVEVWPRVWNAETHRFVADRAGDPADSRLFDLPLEAQTHVARPSVIESRSQATDVASSEAAQPMVTIENASGAVENRMDHDRTLVYRFLTLPVHQRVQICFELGLLPTTSTDLPIDRRFFETVFRRVRERGLRTKLWNAVHLWHGRTDPSPFEDP